MNPHAPPQLRVSHVWRGEVMDDRVLPRPNEAPPNPALYGVAIAIAVVGVAGFLFLGSRMLRGQVADLSRIEIPGDQVVELDEGVTTLYFESRSPLATGTVVESSRHPDEVRCRILRTGKVELGTSPALTQMPPGFKGEYDVEGRIGRAFQAFDVPESGSYRLGCEFAGQTPEDRGVVAFGGEVSAPLTWFVRVGGAALSLGIGLYLFAWVWRRRRTVPVTIGTAAKALLTTPDFGLPPGFSLIRWGARGYVLTLGSRMAGTVKLGNDEMSVEDYVAKGGERAEGTAGAFRATAISPGDWGVLELDDTGDHTLFFQFVKQDAPLPVTRRRDDDLMPPAFAFSAVLHGILLAIAYAQYGGGGNPFVFPGNDSLSNDYLIERPVQVAQMNIEEPKAGVEDGEKDAPPASTVGESGKSGGKGDKPRQRDPNPDKGEPDAIVAKVQNEGLLKHRDTFSKVAARGGFDKRLGNAMARIQGPRNNGGLGGSGRGTGTGVGDDLGGTGTTRGGTGKGPGGGGTAHGDVVTQGVIKTGGKRPPRGKPGGKGVKEVAVSVKTGTASGDLGGLTKAEINKVVQSRKNGIRACYERQLQRSPKLSGKIIVNWKINASGKVTSAKIKSTTMRNGAVEDCIVRQVMRMQFPAKGGGTVNFPFIFHSG